MKKMKWGNCDRIHLGLGRGGGAFWEDNFEAET